MGSKCAHLSFFHGITRIEKSEPVIFLGEWCKAFNHKAKWNKMDAIVAPYHWDDREKLFQDRKYIADVYERYLINISDRIKNFKFRS